MFKSRSHSTSSIPFSSTNSLPPQPHLNFIPSPASNLLNRSRSPSLTHHSPTPIYPSTIPLKRYVHVLWRSDVLKQYTDLQFLYSPPKVLLAPLIMTNTPFPNSSYKPPAELSIEPYSASDPNTFAYESTVKRWPMILTNVIDRIVNINNSLLDSGSSQAEKLREGKSIISQISELKYECARDKELGYVYRIIWRCMVTFENMPHILCLIFVRPILDDGDSNVVLYKEELGKAKAAHKSTWFTTSWLVSPLALFLLI